MLEHHAVVAGNIRFAFGTVNQHGRDRVFTDSIQFCPYRECCPAKTDNTGIVDSLKKTIQIMNYGGFQRRIALHFSIRSNANCFCRTACQLVRFDRGDRTGNSGMQRNRVFYACLCNHLPDFYGIPYRNDGYAGVPGLHIGRDQHLRRRRSHNRSDFSSILVMRHFYS